MNKTNKLKNSANFALFECLSKLTTEQFKIFYGAFVHYWVHHKFFISKQSLFTLRCEINLLCHEMDESFPDQYDEVEAMKSFWKFHPYYFIDNLPIKLIASLFSMHIEDDIDILIDFVKILSEEDIYVAYTYANKALGLNESVDTLVSEAQDHIKFFT